MNIEEDLKTLSHHEHFARFIQLINALREECIADMHEADTDKLHLSCSTKKMCYNQASPSLGVKEWKQSCLTKLSRLTLKPNKIQSEI
jgi:hypothetical protein